MGCARAGSITALLLLLGCAAVPWRLPGAPPASVAPAPDGLLDLRGVVHVHTQGSHDSPGTIESVVRAARGAGVAWVALTEHVRPGTPSRRGRVDGVTLIPGFEIRAEAGSILALGVGERPPETRDLAELVAWIHRAGGLAFVGHFEKSRLADSAAFRQLALDGIELVNLHAAAREGRLVLGLRLLFLPAPIAFRSLLRAPLDNLERWATLPEARNVVGGVDAHAKFRLLGPLGGNVDRYRDLFGLVTTHVLAPDSEVTSILAALREGRSYVAFEGLGRVDRFAFEPGPGGFRIAAPREARLALVCDGLEVDTSRARVAFLAVPPEARQCRGEAWLGRRLWIVTSYRNAAGAPSI